MVIKLDNILFVIVVWTILLHDWFVQQKMVCLFKSSCDSNYNLKKIKKSLKEFSKRLSSLFLDLWASSDKVRKLFSAFPFSRSIY